MASINSIIGRAVIANIIKSSQDMNASILNLASGIKNNANVADFAIGTILSNRSSSLTTANINAGQGKSLVQTAKGALDQILDLLQDQKDLATEAADGSLTDNQRAILNQEFQSITDEINRIATTTKFNNKVLLDGSISGTADLTTVTGQGAENYTLLSTSDYSFSGTTAAGELTTSSVFSPVATNSVGQTAGSATLNFATVGGAVTNAVVTIGGQAVTFSSAGNSTAAATAFVAAAEASVNNTVRSFIYTDNGNGTVTITAADLGTAVNATTFNVTNDGGGAITAVTFGGDTILGANESFSSATGATTGTNRSVSASDITIDDNLQGSLTNFAATLDTSGTQNRATFTVEINGTTYTSQAVTLFGTGGYNSKGNTIKNGQVITFYNSAGATDGDGEFTDNAFTLTVGATDITIAGGDEDAFETDLNNTASGFEDQLAENRINQHRSLILDETNSAGGDFTIAAADGTLFEGIKSFDAQGTNADGDIILVSDTFGTDGAHGAIGPFSFNRATHKLTTTIDGQIYTADLSDNTVNTGGIVDGAGSYNDATNTLTVGAGTILVLHSASTTDGKQLRIDLSNTAHTDILLNTSTLSTQFTDDLDTIFGVSGNPTLSFQVGDEATNTIGFSLGSATTSSIYKDDAGAGKTLDISTDDGAIQAGDVLDNAINSVLSLLSDASAGVTSFTSAITANNVMINNADAASATLLHTDYALESTLLAEATLRYNSAVAMLVQEQSRMQTLLKLVGL